MFLGSRTTINIHSLNVMEDVIIIGAGAAGLFLSANLTTKKAQLFEHCTEVGKKLLITGGGMCNLSNTLATEQFLSHFGSKAQRNFLLPALQTFDANQLCQWLSERNMNTIVRDDGKIFPQSLDAHEVRDLLLKNSKARITTGAKILSITKKDELFLVETPVETYASKKIVLATGGMSYANTGSDGSGYALARALGHSIVEPRPALVALNIKDYPFRPLAGNAVRNACVSFYHPGQNSSYAQIQGDVLFTHDGLSGPAILTPSRAIQKQDVIKLSLIGSENHAATFHKINEMLLCQNKLIFSVLKEAGMSASLAQSVMALTSLEKQTTTAMLNKKTRVHLANLVSNFPLIVSSTKGFSSAMVTSGGVKLSEVHRKTMESNIVKGLFFAGEILDYDGESGGFNLQAAFSTAYLAAQHL